MGGAAKGLLTGRYVDPANMVRQLTWGIPQHTQQIPQFLAIVVVTCSMPRSQEVFLHNETKAHGIPKRLMLQQPILPGHVRLCQLFFDFSNIYGCFQK